jgi:hypothetical protein
MSDMLIAATLLLVASNGAAPCDSYLSLDNLPDDFTEIALNTSSANFISSRSNGSCTCSDEPRLDSLLHKPMLNGINWLCHAATSKERKAIAEAHLCTERYSKTAELPASFQEDAQALFPDGETTWQSNGTCLCDDSPMMERHHGKTISEDVHWYCRPVTKKQRSDYLQRDSK